MKKKFLVSISSIVALTLSFSGCSSSSAPLPKFLVDANTSLELQLDEMDFKKVDNNLYISEETKILNKTEIIPRNQDSYRIKEIRTKYLGTLFHSFYLPSGKYDQNLDLICKAKGGSMIYAFNEIDNSDIIKLNTQFQFNKYINTTKYKEIIKNQEKYHYTYQNVCKQNNSNNIIFLQLDFVDHDFIYPHDYKKEYRTKYTIVDFSDTTLDFIRTREKNLEIYLAKIDAEFSELKKNELQKADELKKKEQQAKALALTEKLQKIKALRERKGQHIMTFVDSFDYRDYRYKSYTGKWEYVSNEESKNECLSTCLSKNIIGDNIYNNLQEALNDGWRVVAKVSTSNQQINANCICKGVSNFILEK